MQVGVRFMTRTLQLSIAALACGVGAAVWGADRAVDAEPGRRPDAAQAVQEGNVELWLQHYHRERGAAWERAGRPNASTAADAPESLPSAGEGTPPERPAEAHSSDR